MSDPRRTPAAVLSRARRRRVRDLLQTALPVLLALVAGSFWLDGWKTAATVLALSLGVLVVVSQQLLKPLDRRWLVARLDAALPALEDSSDLLLAPDPAAFSGLQQMQAERIRARLAGLPPTQLQPHWPRRAAAAGWGIALLLLGLAALTQMIRLPSEIRESGTNLGAPDAVLVPQPTRLSAVQLEVAPPAYTGLPCSRSDQLETSVPAGSTLRWSLAFLPAPRAARIVFHDGESLPLIVNAESRWQAERKDLARSLLYRIEVEADQPLADSKLHKLEVRPDRPPRIQVLAPDRALTLKESNQTDWALAFEISDDYGLGNAALDLTLAQGSGENQTAVHSRQAIAPLPGGSPTQRRYAPKLDLAALGLAAGDDLIVRIEVFDRRTPQPQRTLSPSLILRWPAEQMEEGGGMDGLVQKVLPAYFRSQRQIIIDTEALIAELPGLSEEKLFIRSDTIGVDQRLLRLRYGQFMGEVVEGGPEPPPGEDGHDDHGDEEGSAGGAGEDGHDHGQDAAAQAAGTFGALQGGSALEAFGHTHDIPEAATLLDPQTKELLRSALQEMWQAEAHLRTSQPRLALPYEKRALEYIKQVQQASRIYLARVGLELPPIDPSRRLSGDRSKVRPGRDPLVALDTEDAPIAPVWSALAAAQPEIDLKPLVVWAQARLRTLTAGDEAEAPLLSLIAAADAVQRDPACGDCRDTLQQQLWPLLPRPEAGGTTRLKADAVGAAYLDALQPAPAEASP